MESTKVWRKAYRRLTQANLAIFAGNVVTKLKENATYAEFKDLTATLETTHQQFSSILSASRSGGRELIVEKDRLRDLLYIQLGEVADRLNRMANGNIGIIIGAGFDVLSATPRGVSMLQPPAVLDIRSTGRPGELRVNLKDEEPRLVLQHAIEVSEDGGKTFQNGQYDSRSRFVITNQPRVKDLLVRVRSLGRGNLKSEWTEPVVVAVL